MVVDGLAISILAKLIITFGAKESRRLIGKMANG
jgi:hypothetical protein